MINPYEDLQDIVGKKITYEEFCKLTNEPYKTGSQKKNQIAFMSNYMDIYSHYGDIIINEIYDSKKLLLFEHKSKFVEYIEDLLIKYLSDNKGENVVLTYREMAEYFYMINKDYYKAKYEKWSYVNDLKIATNLDYTQKEVVADSYKDMGLFFNVTDRLIKEIIDSALKSLKNRSLIIIRDNFKLYRRDFNEDTKEFITIEYVCNAEQRKEFLDIRKNVMNRYGINKIQDIIYMPKDQRDKYFEDLAYEMGQSDILNHCTRYANAWNIEYGEKAIDHEYQRIESQNKKLVNSNMQYKLLTTKELDCIHQVIREQLVERFI